MSARTWAYLDKLSENLSDIPFDSKILLDTNRSAFYPPYLEICRSNPQPESAMAFNEGVLWDGLLGV